jgi:hypothetical protein
VDQTVAEEKLTAGWVFLKCHHCSMTSALQGKASLKLLQFSERPVRSVPVRNRVEGNGIERSPAKQDEPRVELGIEHAEHTERTERTNPVLSLPPVPDFLKSERLTGKIEKPAEPKLFESEDEVSQPVPILLEEEKAPWSFQESAAEFASKFASHFSGDWKKSVRQGSVEWAKTIRPYSLPLMLAIVCFASGGYLLRSAKQIREGAWVFPIQNPVNVASDVAPASDSVSQTAAQNEAPSAPVVASAPATAAAAATATAPASAPAPARIPAAHPAPAAAPSEAKVAVLAANAVLRAGPGLHYNKVGTARAELQLLVKGSFDNWIEVRTGSGSKTAWIRGDLVKPIQPEAKQVAKQEAQL